MDLMEYKKQLRKEIYTELNWVKRVLVGSNNCFEIYVDTGEQLSEIIKFSKERPEKYKICRNNGRWVKLQYIIPEEYKSDIDKEIEKLENKIKELKEQRKIENAKNKKQQKIEQLKQQLKELEGE